jgi:hypothetical protein
MLFHLSSDDPNNFATIKLNITPPSYGTSNLRYRIKNFNCSNVAITIDANDYIDIEFPDEERKKWCVKFDVYVLVTKSSDLLKFLKREFDSNEDMPAMTFKFGVTARIVIGCDKKWVITCMSHRVALLIGAFNDTLPIISSFFNNDYNKVIGSIPMLNYGNILYLMSRNESISGVNKNGRELYLSIAYKYNEIIYPGCPLI